METLVRPTRPSVAHVAGLAEVRHVLARLERYFDLDGIIANAADHADIIDYYTGSERLYRFIHDSSAIHMALSTDGRVHRSDFEAQARFVAERVVGSSPENVLELACGRGKNLAVLGRELPAAHVIGLDLTPTHVKMAARVQAPNVNVLQGDFNDVPLRAGSQDVVLIVEALCHSHDVARTLGEARRVLKPGGILIVFDGYRTASSETELRAVQAMERSMAVEAFTPVDDFEQALRDTGFRIESAVEQKQQVMPNLDRLAAWAQPYLRWPLVRAAFRVVIGDRAAENVVAAALMAPAMRAGLWGYWRHVAIAA